MGRNPLSFWMFFFNCVVLISIVVPLETFLRSLVIFFNLLLGKHILYLPCRFVWDKRMVNRQPFFAAPCNLLAWPFIKFNPYFDRLFSHTSRRWKRMVIYLLRRLIGSPSWSVKYVCMRLKSCRYWTVGWSLRSLHWWCHCSPRCCWYCWC